MTKPRCPLCGRPLKELLTSNPLGLARVEMMFCKKCMEDGTLYLATTEFWKAFIRAMDWLKQVTTPAKCDDDLCREFTKRIVEQIKGRRNENTLENK